MLKVFKYLKSSIFSVIVVILLLFAQAFLDLTLPDYTSKIVNVGVQQGGIEDAAITDIGSNTYHTLLLLMDEDDRDYINKQYEITDKYKGEDIYTLKDDSNTSKVSSIMSRPMLILYYAENMDSNSKSDEAISFELPEGMSLEDSLLLMDDASRSEMIKSINKKLKDIPDSIVNQGAVSFVKSEYQRIGIDTDHIQTMYIFKVGLIMLGIALMAMIVGVLIVFVGSRMAAKLSKTLRHKVFTKVVGFSKNEMKSFGQSSLITRTTNDIQQVQMVVVFLLRVVFYAPIIGIGGVIKAMNTNADMTYIIGLAVVLILGVVVTLFAVAMPKFNIVQKLIDKLNLVTREILTGLPVIRAFSNEAHEEERFDEANKRLTKVNLFINRAMSFMMPIMMLVMNCICLLIVYQGAKGVDQGIMQVGDIMAYIQYTMQIIMAFLMISMMSIMLPRANVSAHRIMEVLETKDTIYNNKKLLPFKDSERGKVEFRNVSFRYPDASYDVITDINLVANPGEVTAFIGSTGSGKSTLINLIPRFYDVSDGELLIDGRNVRDVDLKELREKIGFVPQKGVLFTGSIADNIKYGNENISDDDVKKALDISQSTEVCI